MANELDIAKTFLHSRLSEALELEVYPFGEARGATLPYCLYDLTLFPDLTTVNGHIVMSRMEAVVRAIGVGDYFGLLDHVTQIQDALHLTTGEASGGYVQECRRIGLVELPPRVASEGDETMAYEIGVRFKMLISSTVPSARGSPAA